jgi:hypothetical protein
MRMHIGVLALSLLCLFRGAASAESQAKPNTVAAPFEVSGTYIAAFEAAYREFLRISDLSKSRKRLENYRIRFTEDESNYYVKFVPRLAIGDSAREGGETTLGREVQFTVRRTDLAVVRRTYYE